MIIQVIVTIVICLLVLGLILFVVGFSINNDKLEQIGEKFFSFGLVGALISLGTLIVYGIWFLQK